MEQLEKIALVACVVIFGILTNGTSSAARCERIAVPLCQNLRYNTTLMPNFMGHDDQREAARGLGEFGGFLEHNCSTFLKLFVCSVYVPLCSEHVPGAVPACRGLCEEVKRGCLPALLLANLTWPAQLECSNFPEPPKLCMQQPTEDDLSDSIHRSDDSSGEQQLHGYVHHNLRHCPPNTALSGDKCMKVCQSDEIHSKMEYLLFELWTAIWSVFCIAFATFALLTFFIQPNRFRWPARPIIYLSICSFVTSLVYILRWIVGPFTCSGVTVLGKPSDSFLCISSSLLLLFCDMAFALWWCIFCLVWFLSAAREWSTEAIEKISTRLHITIWTLSVLPMIYSLMSSNSIQMDKLTGFCKVTSFILSVIELCFVALGAFIAVLTSVALKNVRKALTYAGRSPLKLDRLICRLGAISVGICVPLFMSLLCNFFGGLTVTLVQVSLKLLSAIFAALWVFSSKTFKTWNKILKPTTFRNKGEIPVAKV